MARTTEPLSGGVVTSKDPALLQPGELSAARNAYYKPGTQSLVRALGRASFGTVTATAHNIVGMRDFQFDNGDHYLVAHSSSNYSIAAVGDTGTFALLASSVGVGTQLESAHYRNRFYLFNGASPQTASATAVNSNLVTYLSATAPGTSPSTRQHGMNPVTSPPQVATATGTFSQTATGYYEYWTTEVAKFTQDGAENVMESTFTNISGPTTQLVSATSVVPVIALPAVQNPGLTTHWRVYRSPKKDKQSDKKFPTGFLITPDISIASATSINDTSTTASASAFPASFNGVSPDTGTFFTDFANAARTSADDNSDATATSTSLISPKQQGVFGFNFGGFSGSVKGIKVEIEALVDTGTSRVDVKLVRNRAADGYFGLGAVNPIVRGPLGDILTKNFVAAKSFTATTSRTVYTLGGETDRWYGADNPTPLSDSDFTPTKFMVVFGFSDSTSTQLSVDYVKVTVYYGATIDSTAVFPTVVYTFGDITAQVGKNGPPPSASTGDFYQDTLVTNDVSNPGVIKYSYPGDPEAFPPTYYIDFETKDNDQVRLVKVVNDRLIVGLDRSIWRVNYLPSERDASFDRGKCKEAISNSYGVIDPMCACVFTPDGSREILAFVSHQGICGTDGYSFNTMSDSQDWRQIMSLTATSSAICLINDAERKLLKFYFRNDSSSYGNETYLCLPFSYAPEHVRMEDGKMILKAGGLTHMRNYDSGTGAYATLESAWSVPRSNGNYGTYLGYGGAAANTTAAGAGKVYFETGSTIPANDPAYQFTTRRMYLAGFANEWKLGDLYGYVSSQTGTQTMRYTPLTIKTGDSTGEVTQTAKSLAVVAGTKPYKIPFNIGAEGMKLNFAVTSGHDDLAMEFLVIDGEDFGYEDSGK